MAISDISVEPLRSTDLARLRPITWAKVDINQVRYNQVGAFTIDVPATDEAWNLIQLDTDGSYIPNLFLIDWHGVFRYPVLAESYNPVRAIDSTGKPTEMITFAGADMLCLLANRIVYRDPTKTWAQQTAGITVISGKAETVIKQLVQANLVDAVETFRRVPHFTVATDLGRGGTVSYPIVMKDSTSASTVSTTTGSTLMDMVRAVAAQSNIGVRIDLVGNQLVFDCYVPRDLSQKVVFSEDLGSLRGYSLSDATPTGNAILMQTGATSGAFTAYTGTGAADPWRRVEIYNDQTSTTDANQITQAQLQAILQGAGVAKLAVTVTDIPRQRFGSDDPANRIQGYREGDIVAADLRDGITYTDVVSAVQLTADATQATYTETVTPTIGAALADTGTDQTAIARLSAQVRVIERRLNQNQKR